MAEPPVSDRAAQYQSKTEKVTHRPQVIGLLRRLRDQRVLLSARVPGHSGLFNSLLLEVDPDRSLILLDELNPRQGHELVCQTGQLRVHCQCKGVELSFNCDVEVHPARSGISFYRAALPEAIDYLQRRSSFRVRVGADLTVPVRLSLNKATASAEAVLVDLSVGGFGATLDSSVELTLGQVLPCVIQLPKGETLEANIEIRVVRVDPARPIQRIGASFRDLKPVQRQVVRRFVAQLEREMLRRKARI
ncbi:MAG: flagellar regulator YcgR PilZN domain-containing protein [Thiohalobacteraceae bacterium]